MTERHIEVRIAVVEERLDNVEEEQLRQRNRLHGLESDRASVRLLAQRIGELTDSVPALAKAAALEAIDLWAEHKDELGNRRWTLRLQWAAAGITFGGLAVTIVALLIGGHP